MLPESESGTAYAALRSNWRADMKAVEIALDRLGVPAAYVEVAPAERAEPGPTT